MRDRNQREADREPKPNARDAIRDDVSERHPIIVTEPFPETYWKGLTS